MTLAIWKIEKNKLETIGATTWHGKQAGEDPNYFIPQNYLDKKHFVLLRTCFGFSDWGFITPMARILKENYPDCKVYIPSEKWIRSIFGNFYSNYVDFWDNPFSNPKKIFDNNPYIDGELNSIDDTIYHDHYRIFDKNNLRTPLAAQMLKFWKIDTKDDLLQPELYFSRMENNIYNNYMKKIIPKEYAIFHLSDRWTPTQSKINKLQSIINNYDMPYVIYAKDNKMLEDFKLPKVAFDLKEILPNNVRLQTICRKNAKVAIGLQTGVLDVLAKYTKVELLLHEGEDLHEHTVNGISYHSVEE